jgi:translocator protein
VTNKWLGLIGFLALCLGVGAIGGFATTHSVVDWYPTLVRPSWTPPSWLFGPVWTLLYVMMAVAAWRVWRRGDERVPMLLFGAQLALNLAWSILFFGAKSPGLALVDIVALWLAIAASIYAFAMKDRIAAFLMVPYLCWVSFALALNSAIWMLN